MRARGALLVALGAPALAACIDLFHATDFETECGLDAAACIQADAAPLACRAPTPRSDACAGSSDAGPSEDSETGPDR